MKVRGRRYECTEPGTEFSWNVYSAFVNEMTANSPSCWHWQGGAAVEVAKDYLVIMRTAKDPKYLYLVAFFKNSSKLLHTATSALARVAHRFHYVPSVVKHFVDRNTRNIGSRVEAAGLEFNVHPSPLFTVVGDSSQNVPDLYWFTDPAVVIELPRDLRITFNFQSNLEPERGKLFATAVGNELRRLMQTKNLKGRITDVTLQSRSAIVTVTEYEPDDLAAWEDLVHSGTDNLLSIEKEEPHIRTQRIYISSFCGHFSVRLSMHLIPAIEPGNKKSFEAAVKRQVSKKHGCRIVYVDSYRKQLKNLERHVLRVDIGFSISSQMTREDAESIAKSFNVNFYNTNFTCKHFYAVDEGSTADAKSVAYKFDDVVWDGQQTDISSH